MTTDKEFEAKLQQQVAELMALSHEQRDAIVAACTICIDTITKKGALVLVGRVPDEDNNVLLRTSAFGAKGPIDAAEMMAYSASSIMHNEQPKNLAPSTGTMQ